MPGLLLLAALIELLIALVIAAIAALLVSSWMRNKLRVLVFAPIAATIAAMCVAGIGLYLLFAPLPPPRPGGGNPWGFGSGPSIAEIAVFVLGVHGFLGAVVGIVVALGILAARAPRTANQHGS